MSKKSNIKILEMCFLAMFLIGMALFFDGLALYGISDTFYPMPLIGIVLLIVSISILKYMEKKEKL